MSHSTGRIENQLLTSRPKPPPATPLPSDIGEEKPHFSQPLVGEGQEEVKGRLSEGLLDSPAILGHSCAHPTGRGINKRNLTFLVLVGCFGWSVWQAPSSGCTLDDEPSGMPALQCLVQGLVAATGVSGQGLFVPQTSSQRWVLLLSCYSVICWLAHLGLVAGSP